MRKLKYSDKVKKAAPIVKAIYGLKDGEALKISYAGKEYKVSAYKSYKEELTYSVWNGINGMNVSKVGRTSLSLYTFDMMSQKTTYTLSLIEAVVI
jgi:hypothetical protein